MSDLTDNLSSHFEGSVEGDAEHNLPSNIEGIIKREEQFTCDECSECYFWVDNGGSCPGWGEWFVDEPVW